MHMILRTIFIFLRKPWLKPTGMGEKTEITMRVLPTDLDFLMHVNNGVYFSFMDFGRWDMIFRNGTYDLARKNKWYSVVASESMKFKKSLKLWDKFTIETQLKGYDDKAFFIQQRFLKKGEVMAVGLVKVRFLKDAGGTVGTKEVMDAFNFQLTNEGSELASDWMQLEGKYLV